MPALKISSVKARKHFGANSLDLTIPAGVCATQGLSPGDVWTVTVGRENGKVTLKYTLAVRADGRPTVGALLARRDGDD